MAQHYSREGGRVAPVWRDIGGQWHLSDGRLPAAINIWETHCGMRRLGIVSIAHAPHGRRIPRYLTPGHSAASACRACGRHDCARSP